VKLDFDIGVKAKISKTLFHPCVETLGKFICKMLLILQLIT